MQLILARIERLGSGIVLLHDTKAQTARMLPAFLRELKRRGYRIVHVVPAGKARPNSQLNRPFCRNLRKTARTLRLWAALVG